MIKVMRSWPFLWPVFALTAFMMLLAWLLPGWTDLLAMLGVLFGMLVGSWASLRAQRLAKRR